MFFEHIKIAANAARVYVQCNCGKEGEDSAESESPEMCRERKVYRRRFFAGSVVSVSSVAGVLTSSVTVSSSGIEVSDMDHRSFGNGSESGGASTPGVRVVRDGTKPFFHSYREAYS